MVSCSSNILLGEKGFMTVHSQVFSEATSVLVEHEMPINMRFYHRFFPQNLMHFEKVLHDPRNLLAIGQLSVAFPTDTSFSVAIGANGVASFSRCYPGVISSLSSER